jgi:hypothetical protein
MKVLLTGASFRQLGTQADQVEALDLSPAPAVPRNGKYRFNEQHVSYRCGGL